MMGWMRPLGIGSLSTLIALASCDAGTASKHTQPSGSSGEHRATLAAPSTKPEFVRRPRDGTAIEPFVRAQLARGQADRRRVLVYVGAPWCEPCQRFHHAVEQGELDRPLSSLRFLEFDLDQDGPELNAAGYGSQLIPLLDVPEATGRAGALRIEGSIKGPTAVEQNLLPRLLSLLGQRQPAP